ncbi:MAG: aminotransferase class I/II-fold pyridoxal phosphate-dependent enzyme [Naasia sp.]
MTTAEPLDELRRRSSAKWSMYPPDVLPLFVAEMDFPLAPPIAARLHELVERSDTGYIGSKDELVAAFAGFAAERWDWRVDPERVFTTTDVSVTIVESLRASIEPGDGVIVTPPVYPPFFDLIPEAGGAVVQVPLLDDDARGYRLDIDGIDQAFTAGARALLLCNPHNPLGLVHEAETLRALAQVAARHGATIVSDEIHGPLTHSDARFSPYLSVSDEARQTGIAVTAASKGWNVAGLKCALFVAASDEMTRRLASMPYEVAFRTSIFGLHASAVAYGQCAGWLDETVSTIEANRRLLADLLAEHLPGVGYREPRAGYLAWLDLRSRGLGDDPAEAILERARVALSSGPGFGAQGRGFARINIGCAPDVLEEAVRRIAAI